MRVTKVAKALRIFFSHERLLDVESDRETLGSTTTMPFVSWLAAHRHSLLLEFAVSRYAAYNGFCVVVILRS
jgi:hypothetical protein